MKQRFARLGGTITGVPVVGRYADCLIQQYIFFLFNDWVIDDFNHTRKIKRAAEFLSPTE